MNFCYFLETRADKETGIETGRRKDARAKGQAGGWGSHRESQQERTFLNIRRREMHSVQVHTRTTLPYAYIIYAHTTYTYISSSVSEKGQPARLFKLLNFKLSLTYAN